MVSKIQQDPFAEDEDEIIHIPTVRRDPFDEESREDAPVMNSDEKPSKKVRWISQLSCIVHRPQSKRKEKQQNQSTTEPKVNFTAGRLAGRALSTVEENLDEDVQSNIFSEHPIPEEDEVDEWDHQEYALPELKDTLSTSTDTAASSVSTP